MRTKFHAIYLLSFFIISGCSVETVRPGADSKKASVANSELGVAYLAKGDYKVAMNKLKKAIAFDDSNANAHHYIAELYRRLEQNDLASEHFKEAMDLDDENSSIKNNYGIFLCGTGSYEEGLMLFNKVLADPLYDNKGQAYENMGICAEKQGNIRNAEKYFETALKFNLNLPSALLGLAQIYFDNKKIKASYAYLKRHNKLVRPTAESLWLGLLIARKKGYKGKAGSLALKLKSYFPESKEVKLLKKLKIR